MMDFVFIGELTQTMVVISFFVYVCCSCCCVMCFVLILAVTQIKRAAHCSRAYVVLFSLVLESRYVQHHMGMMICDAMGIPNRPNTHSQPASYTQSDTNR